MIRTALAVLLLSVSVVGGGSALLFLTRNPDFEAGVYSAPAQTPATVSDFAAEMSFADCPPELPSPDSSTVVAVVEDETVLPNYLDAILPPPYGIPVICGYITTESGIDPLSVLPSPAP